MGESRSEKEKVALNSHMQLGPLSQPSENAWLGTPFS